MGLIRDIIENKKEVVKCSIDSYPCSGYYTGICGMIINIKEIIIKAKREKIIPESKTCIYSTDN